MMIPSGMITQFLSLSLSFCIYFPFETTKKYVFANKNETGKKERKKRKKKRRQTGKNKSKRAGKTYKLDPREEKQVIVAQNSVNSDAKNEITREAL